MVGLDIAGIDLRLPDIAEPLPPAADGGRGRPAGVIEVNAVPGLRMHLAPVRGRARDVGDAIVRSMFPAGSDGRIPTAAVTGTNGKTTVARLTAHLLGDTGMRVGLTTTDGVSIDGRTVFRADATGPLLGADGARRPGRAGGRAGDRARRPDAARARATTGRTSA